MFFLSALEIKAISLLPPAGPEDLTSLDEVLLRALLKRIDDSEFFNYLCRLKALCSSASHFVSILQPHIKEICEFPFDSIAVDEERKNRYLKNFKKKLVHLFKEPPHDEELPEVIEILFLPVHASSLIETPSGAGADFHQKGKFQYSKKFIEMRFFLSMFNEVTDVSFSPVLIDIFHQRYAIESKFNSFKVLKELEIHIPEIFVLQLFYDMKIFNEAVLSPVMLSCLLISQSISKTTKRSFFDEAELPEKMILSSWLSTVTDWHRKLLSLLATEVSSSDLFIALLERGYFSGDLLSLFYLRLLESESWDLNLISQPLAYAFLQKQSPFFNHHCVSGRFYFLKEVHLKDLYRFIERGLSFYDPIVNMSAIFDDPSLMIKILSHSRFSPTQNAALLYYRMFSMDRIESSLLECPTVQKSFEDPHSFLTVIFLEFKHMKTLSSEFRNEIIADLENGCGVFLAYTDYVFFLAKKRLGMLEIPTSSVENCRSIVYRYENLSVPSYTLFVFLIAGKLEEFKEVLSFISAELSLDESLKLALLKCTYALSDQERFNFLSLQYPSLAFDFCLTEECQEIIFLRNFKELMAKKSGPRFSPHLTLPQLKALDKKIKILEAAQREKDAALWGSDLVGPDEKRKDKIKNQKSKPKIKSKLTTPSTSVSAGSVVSVGSVCAVSSVVLDVSESSGASAGVSFCMPVDPGFEEESWVSPQAENTKERVKKGVLKSTAAVRSLLRSTRINHESSCVHSLYPLSRATVGLPLPESLPEDIVEFPFRTQRSSFNRVFSESVESLSAAVESAIPAPASVAAPAPAPEAKPLVERLAAVASDDKKKKNTGLLVPPHFVRVPYPVPAPYPMPVRLPVHVPVHVPVPVPVPVYVPVLPTQPPVYHGFFAPAVSRKKEELPFLPDPLKAYGLKKPVFSSYCYLNPIRYESEGVMQESATLYTVEWFNYVIRDFQEVFDFKPSSGGVIRIDDMEEFEKQRFRFDYFPEYGKDAFKLTNIETGRQYSVAQVTSLKLIRPGVKDALDVNYEEVSSQIAP